MGAYFNPGNESFTKDSKSRIYVDKTGLLEKVNTLIGSSENCIAVSHARRFGKSQAAGMIDAYYSCGSDSKELFAPYEIATKPDFEEHLNKYNVIHLDISSFMDYYKDNLVEKILETLYRELKEQYPSILDLANPIGAILMQVYELSEKPFVIIIDEWDCVVRNHADRPDLVHVYLQFLHSLFKSEESKKFLALAYITGILPIKKIKDESALNNFVEYTMLESNELTPYFGFTQKEVEQLCMQYGMDFESFKEWYNGYLIDGIHMYNPNSVYRAMVTKKLNSYLSRALSEVSHELSASHTDALDEVFHEFSESCWKNTSAFDTINSYITLNFAGLKEDILTMLAGGRVSVNVNTFQNDLSVINSKDEALTALIHLGYLGYDAVMEEAYIPNYEVGLAYQAALSTGEWKEIAASISRCQELLNATIRGNAEKVADSAIKQIKERRYTGNLKGYGKKILLVGISYDKKSENKKHECVIEEW